MDNRLECRDKRGGVGVLNHVASIDNPSRTKVAIFAGSETELDPPSGLVVITKGSTIREIPRERASAPIS